MARSPGIKRDAHGVRDINAVVESRGSTDIQHDKNRRRETKTDDRQMVEERKDLSRRMAELTGRGGQ